MNVLPEGACRRQRIAPRVAKSQMLCVNPSRRRGFARDQDKR
jgi:hypothetical protein